MAAPSSTGGPKTRRRLVAGGLVGSVALVLLFVARDPPDQARLQGAWVGDGRRLTVTGDLAVMQFDGSPRADRMYFRLDTGTDPRRIVVFDAAGLGVERPVTLLGVRVSRPAAAAPWFETTGVYELRGDRLRLNLPTSSGEVPAGFDPPGHVIELRRE